MKRKILIGAGLFGAALYLYNASWVTGPSGRALELQAHRGVHQTFPTEAVTNETCTAAIIDPPSHTFIENTLPSMQAAIDYGAQSIEIDVHPTTDNEFVVFHDWTLDCRTEGIGKTRDHDLASLKALDVGFGYTFDQGETYPFRGRFIGAMPTLNEVLDAFSDTDFLVNVKSRSREEGDLLATYTQGRKRLSFTGHPVPMEAVKAARPDVIIMTKTGVTACFKTYVLTGWTGHVPHACRNTIIPVPQNYTGLIWGWPNKFEKRLATHNSRVAIIAPYHKGRATSLIDTPEQFAKVPDGFGGIVITNKIEVIGPLMTERETVNKN